MKRDQNGKFTTGNPGKPKGAKNRTTKEIKELMNLFISKNLEDLQSEYEKLEPREKLQFFERVLKYVIPQQRDINQTIDINSLSENEMDLLIGKITKTDKNEI